MEPAVPGRGVHEVSMSSITPLRTYPSAGLQGTNAGASARDQSPMPALFADDRAGKAVSTIIRILMEAQGNSAVAARAPGASVSVSTGSGNDAISIDANAADIIDSGDGNDTISVHTAGGHSYWGDALLTSVSRLYAGATTRSRSPHTAPPPTSTAAAGTTRSQSPAH